MVGDPVVVQSYLRNPGFAEKDYQLQMMELHRKVQSLEKALEESNCFRMQVETELENKISHCKSHHTGEHFSHGVQGSVRY